MTAPLPKTSSGSAPAGRPAPNGRPAAAGRTPAGRSRVAVAVAVAVGGLLLAGCSAAEDAAQSVQSAASSKASEAVGSAAAEASSKASEALESAKASASAKVSEAAGGAVRTQVCNLVKDGAVSDADASALSGLADAAAKAGLPQDVVAAAQKVADAGADATAQQVEELKAKVCTTS